MRYKIFISGVQKELKTERRQIKKFIENHALFGEYFEIFLFEDLPAKTQAPQSVYLNEVRKSDIYLVIIGREYGSIVSNDTSATELEYNQAKKHKKEILAYILGNDDVRRESKTKQFITKIRKADTGHCCKRFTYLSELENHVHNSLLDFLREEGIVGKSEFDRAICHGSSFRDLDQEKIHWFLRLAKEKRSFPAEKMSSIKNAFVHLNLLRGNRLTNAAVCLFSKNVKKFHLQSEVKCLHFYGTKIEKPFASYRIYDGTLFEQIDQTVSFVLSCLRLPVVQQSGTAQVSRPLEIPKFVITEAIVNAIAHRDYNSNGAVQIMVFADRVEIWNPGRLSSQLTIERLKKPHTSYPFNPLIAEILYLADYIQKAGSGTIEMIKQCRDHKIPDPKFSYSNREFRVVMKRKPLVSPVKEKTTQKTTQKILALIKNNPNITRQELAQALSLSENGIKFHLRNLKANNFLRRIGPDKGGHWEVL